MANKGLKTMLKDRDKKVLQWIEDYSCISLKQANVMFFDGIYVSCRRRMAKLQSDGFLNSYINPVNGEKIYYREKGKKRRHHDLLIFDFCAEVVKKGGEILYMKLEPRLLNDTIRPDSYIEFSLGNKVFMILLEVDYKHYTSMEKMQRYEKLFLSNEMQDQYGMFPKVIIANPISSLRYNSSNFDVIYTDLEFSNLDRLLFFK